MTSKRHEGNGLKPKYDPLREHNYHSVVVLPLHNSPHKYEIRCVDCDKHVKWATLAEYMAYMSVLIDRK